MNSTWEDEWDLVVQEPDRHGQLCRLCIAQVPGTPSHRQGGNGSPYCCAVVQLYAATCAAVRRKRIPVGGNREQGDGWEPLISPGPLVNCPGLNTSCSVFCLPFSSLGCNVCVVGCSQVSSAAMMDVFSLPVSIPPVRPLSASSSTLLLAAVC